MERLIRDHPLAVLAATLAISVAVSVIFFSDQKLSHLPGPLLSRYVNLGLKYQNLRGNRWDYIDGLHNRYGAIVRVAPDEVSVATTQATKELYKMGSEFYKSSFYDIFNGVKPNAPNSTFSERDPKLHSQFRRLRANAFAEKSVKGMESFISRSTRLTAQRMAEECKKNGYTDVFKWFLFMATDVVGEASFGESFKMLQTGEPNQYTRDLQMVVSSALIRTELPWLITIFMYLGLGKRVIQVIERMTVYATDSIDRYYKNYLEDPDNVKPSLLSKEFASLSDGSISRERLEINARGNIIAGSDTTSVAATSVVFMLALHPTEEAKLIAEVAALSPDFTEEALRHLPHLDNVIQETLRLCPPAGSSLPREVPRSGTTLSNYFIPGGVTIGVPTYTIQRDPSIFEDATSFKPARWDNPTTEMKDAFVAFGGGSRKCLGLHFAMVELRLALCHFYRTFTHGMELATGKEGWKGEDDMVAFQAFLARPRGQKCLLRERKSL